MSKTKITHQDNMNWWLTTLSRVIDVVDDKGWAQCSNRVHILVKPALVKYVWKVIRFLSEITYQGRFYEPHLLKVLKRWAFCNFKEKNCFRTGVSTAMTCSILSAKFQKQTTTVRIAVVRLVMFCLTIALPQVKIQAPITNQHLLRRPRLYPRLLMMKIRKRKIVSLWFQSNFQVKMKTNSNSFRLNVMHF